MFFLRQAQYEEGESTGHMLALLARSQSSPVSTILSTGTLAGGVTMCPVEILNVFKNYYSDLYRSKVGEVDREIKDFMQGLTP